MLELPQQTEAGRQPLYFSRLNSKTKIPGKDHAFLGVALSTLCQYHKHARVLPHCRNLVHISVSKGAKKEPPAWLLHESEGRFLLELLEI